MTCMFRIQGTVVADGINDAPVSPLNNETVEDLENDFSQNPERQVGRFLTDEEKEQMRLEDEERHVDELEYDC